MNLNDDDTQLWTHGYCAGRIDERKAKASARTWRGRLLASVRMLFRGV